MKRMTVVFDEDALYTAVKVAAVQRNCALKDLIPSILKEWLETEGWSGPGTQLSSRPRKPSAKKKRAK